MFRLVLAHQVQRAGTDGDKQSDSRMAQCQPIQAMKLIALARDYDGREMHSGDSTHGKFVVHLLSLSNEIYD